MQVGVLRLRVVGIQFRQAHVFYHAPLSRAGFDVAVVLFVEGVLLDTVV